MSKKEKKNLIIQLGKRFLNSTNPDTLKILKNEMIDIVISAGYSDDNLLSIQLGIKEWGDLSKYINAVKENKLDEKLKRSTNLSLVGLSTLIDFSQLGS